MASALQLTAAATLINGYGITTNPRVLSQIGQFQSQPTIALMSNIFTNASNLDSNIANVAIPLLSNIGTGAAQGQFLLDLYPANVSPVCTGTITQYPGGLNRVSGAIQSQAAGPFSNGIPGFANLFSVSYGYALQVFDTVASMGVLKNKTYGQSGINFTGRLDLSTGGVGANGALLASVVEGWGTMYDTTNLNLIGDPYVFGQNLINQGLAQYGNLGKKLIAAGLDITDITKIPTTQTVVSTQETTTTIATEVGKISLPIIDNVYSTNTVTGNSVDVIESIYDSITGEDLASIIQATGFTGSTVNLKTLADFLNFNKVVASDAVGQLRDLGIADFREFGNYIHGRIGHGSFMSWSSFARTLRDIEVPALVNEVVTASTTKVLSANTITTIRAITGFGSGSLTNHVISDYLGACAGMPYVPILNTINNQYETLTATVYPAVQSLDTAIVDTYNAYVSSGNSFTINSDWITANIALVQQTLNAIPQSAISAIQTLFYTMLDHLTLEVTNIQKAGGTFSSSTANLLQGFGLNIGDIASDKNRLETYQFFANLITNNDYGDIIKSVIAESINTRVLSTTGISISNDPEPMNALAQAQAQGISITTYLSQNK